MMTAAGSKQTERQHSTTQERHVLALEQIADEMVLVCRHLERLGDRFCEAQTLPEKAADELPATTRELPSGVTRTLVERFHVGSYLYSKLDDAVAELDRVRGDGAKEVDRLMARNLD